MVIIMMSVKEAMNIIINNYDCSKSEFISFLEFLCDSVDNVDNDIRLATLGNYENKICFIFKCIFDMIEGTKFIKCDEHCNDDLLFDEINVLPHFALVDLINGLDIFDYIVIDYEAPDEVYGFYKLRNLFQVYFIKESLNEFSDEDIISIIDVIDDLDLFDYVCIKDYLNN